MNIANYYIINWLPRGLRGNGWKGLSSWPNRIGFYAIFSTKNHTAHVKVIT